MFFEANNFFVNLPYCGGLLPRFSDDSVYCHSSCSVSIIPPIQPLITRILQYTGSLSVVVISSHQQSTMVHHCDTIATVECLSPGHTTITRYVQVRVFSKLRTNGPMSYDNSRGRCLHKTK